MQLKSPRPFYVALEGRNQRRPLSDNQRKTVLEISRSMIVLPSLNFEMRFLLDSDPFSFATPRQAEGGLHILSNMRCKDELGG